MRLSPSYLLPLLLVAAGCAAPSTVRDPAPAAAPVDWRSLVGCYRAGGRHLALDSVPFLPLFRVEEGPRLVRSSDSFWRRGYDSYWRMNAPDSVRVVWDASLHGTQIDFAVRGDSLVGVESGHSDIAGAPDSREKVVAVRETCLPDARYYPAPPDSARAALLFGYAAAMPSDSLLAADPWRAVAPVHAWIDAHPEVLSDLIFRLHARVLFERAARADARRGFRDLVGTYRVEVQRTGGAPQVVYGRTEIRPVLALHSEDTSAVVLNQPPGYRLRFTLAGDSSSLPKPGPGRRHRTPLGGNDAANSEFEVRLPAVTSPDGTRRYRAYVMLVNFGYYFRDKDRPVYDWDYEWFRQRYSHDGPNVYAEFVVSPDGRVTFTQRQELGPDRVVTLRGERISGDSWQCTPVDERC